MALQDCQKVSKNIARILQLCKARVPHYIGCDQPILGQALPATHCKAHAQAHWLMRECSQECGSDLESISQIPRSSTFASLPKITDIAGYGEDGLGDVPDAYPSGGVDDPPNPG